MNKKSDLTVLVLGGSGLLGYHCVNELQKNYKVVQTYNQNIVKTNNGEHFAFTNENSLEDLLIRYKPSVIINTIGFVTVDGCEDNPEMANKMNSYFVSYLIKLMCETDLESSHLIQISTASVYGNHDHEPEPWIETDNTNPLSVYAKTKLEGEFKANNHKGPVTIIRTDFYGINPLSVKSLLWWIIDRAANGEILDGWENIYFSPVSAWTLSSIIRQIIQNKIEGIYNVACNDVCNKYSFAKAVCKLIGIEATIAKSRLVQDSKLLRPNYTVLNTSKLNSVLDADFSWNDDLASYMQNLPKFPKNIPFK